MINGAECAIFHLLDLSYFLHLSHKYCLGISISKFFSRDNSTTWQHSSYNSIIKPCSSTPLLDPVTFLDLPVKVVALLVLAFNVSTIHSVSFMPLASAAIFHIPLSDRVHRAWMYDSAFWSSGLVALLGLPVRPCGLFLSMIFKIFFQINKFTFLV